MKRFSFKLEALLNYREYLERLSKQKTAIVHIDINNCENLINNLKGEHGKRVEAMDNLIQKEIESKTFKEHNDYLNMVDNRIEDENLKKKKLKKQLEQRLLDLKKKSVKKKIMELYKDKLKKRYKKEFLKNEQKELDEISNIKTIKALSNETI